ARERRSEKKAGEHPSRPHVRSPEARGDPSMPTSLPARTTFPAPSVGLIDFAKTLIFVYAMIAGPISLMFAIAYHFGMFEGSTLFEAILKALGPGLLYSDPQLIGMF